MSLRRSLAVAALALTATIPSIAGAHDVSVPAACILRNRQVESVKPLKVERPYLGGRTGFPKLQGATVNVKAEPGLSAQWLRVDLGQRIQECGLNPKKVKVEVVPTRDGYAVKFMGTQNGTGKSVLEQTKGVAVSSEY